MKDLRPAPGPDETLDALLDGRLRFFQPRKGYRFSVDAPLLAGFALPGPGDEVADLGAGCGVVAILLAHISSARRLVAVEVQEDLAALAGRNILLNGLEDRVEALHSDVRSFAVRTPAGSFDLVVSNPPYQPTGKTRPSASPQRAVSRQEILLKPVELFAASSRLLRPGGRFCMIHRPWRWDKIRPIMTQQGLYPRRLRYVIPHRNKPANMVLVEASNRVSGEVNTDRPFVLFEKDGSYTVEADDLLRGGEITRAEGLLKSPRINDEK